MWTTRVGQREKRDSQRSADEGAVCGKTSDGTGAHSADLLSPGRKECAHVGTEFVFIRSLVPIP